MVDHLKTGASLVLVFVVAVAAAAQQRDGAPPDALAGRVSERMRALQREAERLAAEARSLLTDLRKLEVDRDLQVERVRAAEAATAAAQTALQQATARLAALEQERVAQLPDLKAQLVDVYKRGRGGYLRMLLEADNVRDLGRTARALAALVRLNEERVAAHRRTMDAVRRERAALEQKSMELQAVEAEARVARAAAERAIAARTALIARIDTERDLNAQLAGELQVAQQRLQQQVASVEAGSAPDASGAPLAPFRGALEWPVAGRVTGEFGEADRDASAGVRSGVEIAAPVGTPVTAIHRGMVAFADPFAGFGNLVILDHGSNNFSVYGYLGSIGVSRGQTVEGGDELGQVGTAPAGPASLYFEIRIDGRSVDPLQWLKAR